MTLPYYIIIVSLDKKRPSPGGDGLLLFRNYT